MRNWLKIFLITLIILTSTLVFFPNETKAQADSANGDYSITPNRINYIERFCNDTQNINGTNCSRQTFLDFHRWLDQEYPTTNSVGFQRQREAIQDYIDWANYDQQIEELTRQQSGINVSTTEDAAEYEYLQTRIDSLQQDRDVARSYLEGNTSARQDQTNQNQIDGKFKCSIWSARGLADCGLYLTAWSMRLVVSVFAWVLYIANELFNAVLYVSVIDFHKYLETGANNTANGETLYFPLGDAINIGWKTIRDLFNIAFIFILLYVAIGTILRSSQVNAKKMITNIIIAALLINFSAVFPKLVIDATNVVSVTFYRGMANGDNRTVVTGAPDLVLALIGKMPLGINYLSGNVDSQLTIAEESREGIVRIILESFMQIILILVAAFVLFTVAFMLLVRLIMLLILIITSPVAFGTMILPDQFKKSGKDWWSQLFSETIWLPVFMIMFYVTIQIAQAISITNSAPTVNDAGTGSVSLEFFRLLIAYIILIGFMIYSLVQAKKIGGMGAAGAMALAGGITALGAGAATGVLKTGYRTARHPIDTGKTIKGAFSGGGAIGKQLLRGDFSGVKEVGAKLAKTDFGKRVISTAKPLKENVLHPLRYASDKVAETSGLGVGFLGKAGKERAEDAKKLKDAEKDEEDKKKKEKKEKIELANKTIENIGKSVADYFDENGEVKSQFKTGDVINTDVQDRINKAKNDISEALSDFNAKDFKELRVDHLVNPVAAKALSYNEANAIRENLKHGQLDKMRDYLKNQNGEVYKQMQEHGPTRASWGIEKPAPATPNPTPTPAPTTPPPIPGTAPAGGANTPPGGTHKYDAAQYNLAKTELNNLGRRFGQGTLTKSEILNTLDRNLEKVADRSHDEVFNFFVNQHPTIFKELQDNGANIDDYKKLSGLISGPIMMRLRTEFERAAANPAAASPLQPYAGGAFSQFITDRNNIDINGQLII